MKRKDYLITLLENTRRALDCANESVEPWSKLGPVMDECIEDLRKRGEEVFGGDSHYITDPDPEFDFAVLERVCQNIGDLVEIAKVREYDDVVLDKASGKLIEKELKMPDVPHLSNGTIVKLTEVIGCCQNCWTSQTVIGQCPDCQKGYVQLYIEKGTELTITDWLIIDGDVWYECDQYNGKGDLVRDHVTLKSDWLE